MSDQDYHEILRSIEGHLRILSRVASLESLRSSSFADASIGERALFLSSLGFDISAISELLQKPKDTVAPELSRAKKQKQKSKKVRG